MKLKLLIPFYLLLFLLSSFSSYTQSCKDEYKPSTWVNKKYSYQNRSNGACEGFIKDKVSASKLEVVSFTFGKLTYDSEKEKTIYLQTPKGFASQLNIEAQGIPFDLDYRMNAIISSSKILDWNTDEVLLHNDRTKHYENIGVVGYLKKGSKKIMVPLRIVDNDYKDYLFFIVRSNGSLRSVKWKTNADSSWQKKSGSYEKGEPVQLVFENNSKIKKMELSAIDNRGDLRNWTIDLKMK